MSKEIIEGLCWFSDGDKVWYLGLLDDIEVEDGYPVYYKFESIELRTHPTGFKFEDKRTRDFQYCVPLSIAETAKQAEPLKKSKIEYTF